MREIKTNRREWEKLTEEEQKYVTSYLNKKGLLKAGDLIVGLDAVEPITLQISKKAGCPDVCAAIANHTYELCIENGGNAGTCAKDADETYNECCASHES